MSDDIIHANDQQRFEQLLPFYLTQKLSLEDKSFIQSYIASNPEAKKAVKFTEQLSRIIRNTGVNRNPDVALSRLLADFRPRKRLSLIKRLMAKLRTLGISPPLAIALLVIISQGVGYTAHKMNWLTVPSNAVHAKANPHLTITIKDGADAGAIAIIIDKFGGQIIHSTAATDAQKIFISIMDKAKIPGLIDALMDSGLIESAAVLM